MRYRRALRERVCPRLVPLQTESKVPNSLQYFLTFVGRFAMIAANNTTNKEKFAV